MDFLYKVDYKLCSILNRVSSNRCFSFEGVLMRYVRRLSLRINKNYPPVDKRENEGNDIVWVFWAQGEKRMPPLIRSCYESIKRHALGKVNLISLDSIEDFVHLPSFVYEKIQTKAISYTQLSDILRFALLRDYGGWWLDATIFLIEDLPRTTGLFTIKNAFNDSCISKFRWSSFLWHLSPHHPLAHFVYEGLIQYWKKNDFAVEYLLIDYFIKYHYDHAPSFRQEIDNLSENNPDLYFFQSDAASKSFDQASWDRIKKSTTIFKTSYKVGIENAPPDSYCKRLLFE